MKVKNIRKYLTEEQITERVKAMSRSEKILILQLRERMSLWSRTSLIPEEH